MASGPVGLLDLPAPVFAAVDGVLQALPPFARLLLWGIVAGLGSMLLYRALSPQRRIVQAKSAMRRARQALDHHDGEFSEARPLLKELLTQSARQFSLTVPTTLATAVPIAALFVWLGSAYGHAYPPPAAEVDVRVQPAGLNGQWIDAGPVPGVRVTDALGTDLGVFELHAPVPVLHPRRWWNTLIANPAGYLPDHIPVQRVDMSLPRQQHLAVGPPWARGWELPFLCALLVSALAAKAYLRIH